MNLTKFKSQQRGKDQTERAKIKLRIKSSSTSLELPLPVMIAIRGDAFLVLRTEGDKVRAPVFSALYLGPFITTKTYFKNFRYISSAIGS